MASFAPIKGTRTEIGNTPIVEGQFLVETDQVQNRIYLDKGTGTGQRIIVGGNSNYVDLESSVIAGTGAATTVSFQNAIITTDGWYDILSEEFTDATGTTPVSGLSNKLTPLQYTDVVLDTTTSPYTVNVNLSSVPNGKFYKVTLRVGINS